MMTGIIRGEAVGTQGKKVVSHAVGFEVDVGYIEFVTSFSLPLCLFMISIIKMKIGA